MAGRPDIRQAIRAIGLARHDLCEFERFGQRQSERFDCLDITPDGLGHFGFCGWTQVLVLELFAERNDLVL